MKEKSAIYGNIFDSAYKRVKNCCQPPIIDTVNSTVDNIGYIISIIILSIIIIIIITGLYFKYKQQNIIPYNDLANSE